MPVINPNEESTIYAINDKFPEQYKEEIFRLWYMHGKPSVAKLFKLVKSEIGICTELGYYPGIVAIGNWIRNLFRPRAEFLDLEFQRQNNEKMIAEKVEMLNRHVSLAKEMQDMSIDYLREHGLGSSKTAVAALINGLRIERESSGLAPMVLALSKVTDEDLLKQLEDVIHKGNITYFGPNEEVLDGSEEAIENEFEDGMSDL